MPRCKRCGVSGSRDSWPRYERNGRLKVVCSGCDAELNELRAEDADAKARGYLDRTHTPEYKRLQREREANSQGRTLPAYVPQAEQNRVARMNRAERQADQVRAKWAAEWLKPFRDEKALYQSDPEFREQHKADVRESYARRRTREIARVGEYKRKHSDRNIAWNETRKERETVLGDGTATPEAIARLKAKATHCAYCGERLTEKQTDHMEPLALGGEHSLHNIVIVCPGCNGRKARLSYPEWIERVDTRHRARVEALWQHRQCHEVAA